MFHRFHAARDVAATAPSRRTASRLRRPLYERDKDASVRDNVVSASVTKRVSVTV